MDSSNAFEPGDLRNVLFRESVSESIPRVAGVLNTSHQPVKRRGILHRVEWSCCRGAVYRQNDSQKGKPNIGGSYTTCWALLHEPLTVTQGGRQRGPCG